MRLFPIPRLTIMSVCSVIATAAIGAPDDMVIHMSNGTDPVKTEISASTRITFDGAAMVISSAGNQTLNIPLGNIDRMVFDLSTSSDEEIESALSEELTFAVSHKSVKVVSASGSADVVLRVYDTAGRQVGIVAGKGSAEYDFTDKKSGIYILTCADKSIKYLNK